jgi:hypothetical protein
MNPQKPKLTKLNRICKFPLNLLSLALLALLAFTNAASAQLVVTTAAQSGSVPFTPSWTPVTGGLLDNLVPTTATGNFAEFGTGGSANNLTTVGESVQVRSYSGAGNLEMCGNDGTCGSLLVYTLTNGAPAFGYNITNITVYGGWQDNGRDAQNYTIYYSTVDAPNTFLPLTEVQYVPPGTSGANATRVIIDGGKLNGPIVVNVYALKFDFTHPSSAQEAGAAGYTAITVQGTAATADALPSPITDSIQSVPAGSPPSWTLETPSLIAGQTPSSITGSGYGNSTPGSGDFGTTGPSVLTGGSIGNANSAAIYCWGGTGDGIQSMIYTLTNSVNGSDLTNIVVYSGWTDSGAGASRYGQYYTISYSTVSAPSTFIPLSYVFLRPAFPGPGNPSHRVALQNETGAALAKNVYQLKFDFTLQGGNDFGFSGYSQIILQGTNSAAPPHGLSPILTQDTLPSYVAALVGESITFSAAFSNTPPAALQWIVVKSGVTNNVGAGINVTNNGVITSTLTLNNLQVSDSGTYMLEATNSIDSTALPAYSTGAPLTVTSGSAPVNGIVLSYATQTGLSGNNYTPQWTVTSGANDLLAGLATTAEAGNFFNLSGGGTFALTDGTIGPVNFDGSSAGLFAVAGMSGGASSGLYAIYTLPAGPANGYNLTNITVYSGWQDNTRDEQAYNVSYATAQNPTSFISLGTVEYNPVVPVGAPTVNRVTLTAATGTVMAPNVVALRFDFTDPFTENGGAGYSEITVGGTAAATVTAPPLQIAVDVQTNIPAATSPTFPDLAGWTMETNSLIEGQPPSSVGPGNFTGTGGSGAPVLTDGTFGPANNAASYAFGGFGGGLSVTYSLGGATLTNIVVYSGWHDYGEDGQFYNVLYSTTNAPTIFIPLASIWDNPPTGLYFGTDAERVDISMSTGAPLATNVAAVKFDFSPQDDIYIDYGSSAYAQIVLQGSLAAAPTPPTFASPVISGSNLILTGTGGTPNSGYTVLMTTNLTPPVIWTTSTTGTLNGTGAFSNAIPITATQPASFFRIRMP